ncbi:hypothetical protein SBA6_200005 [Candidatus Sulfopaludibacter sp. SbA6]|nr:hypothetical protein SBA6_200005 [Candidatus Sulfopaludibacter sp. SbA6]
MRADFVCSGELGGRSGTRHWGGGTHNEATAPAVFAAQRDEACRLRMECGRRIPIPSTSKWTTNRRSRTGSVFAIVSSAPW